MALLLALSLVGCASVPAGGSSAATNPMDPWESWNRKVFAFNDALDDAVVKPVAEGYKKVVPQAVRTGVTNVFGNLADVWSTVNQLLQGKVKLGFEMGARVLANTFFGFGGLFDPATEMGLTRRSEDFGQTLGQWGLAAGPYLVLPLLGPSTVRDTGGWVVDRVVAAPSRLPETDAGRYSLTALQLIDTRTNLLATTKLLGEVALDRYSFVRDAYLSRRLDQVFDGAPPLETFDDGPEDPPPPKKP
jgi:phospholipid-binding lipoprotein MlaA